MVIKFSDKKEGKMKKPHNFDEPNSLLTGDILDTSQMQMNGLEQY